MLWKAGIFPAFLKYALYKMNETLLLCCRLQKGIIMQMDDLVSMQKLKSVLYSILSVSAFDG